jgi:hypothetical protein
MARPTVPDPATGEWILNISKSNFAISPAPKSSVMKVEAWEDGLRVKIYAVDMHGNSIHQETAYKFDGRDYVLKGFPVADTVSAKRINLRASESVWKKRGKVILTVRAVVSIDGKTMSLTRASWDAQGRALDELLIYDRQ